MFRKFEKVHSTVHLSTTSGQLNYFRNQTEGKETPNTRALPRGKPQSELFFLKFSKIPGGSTVHERDSKIFNTGFSAWNAVINDSNDKQSPPNSNRNFNLQKCHPVSHTWRQMIENNFRRMIECLKLEYLTQCSPKANNLARDC